MGNTDFSLCVSKWLSDLISWAIGCRREAEVRAQAPLKGLFVVCVWCVSAFCDKARQRTRSKSRSSWEMTEAPKRHIRVLESFRLDRTLEISRIPAGGLRSGSLGWELGTSVRLRNQIWWTTQSRVRDENAGPLKEYLWSFTPFTRVHCPRSDCKPSPDSVVLTVWCGGWWIPIPLRVYFSEREHC